MHDAADRGRGLPAAAPVVPARSTRATVVQMMLATASDAVVVPDNDRLLGIVTTHG